MVSQSVVPPNLSNPNVEIKNNSRKSTSVLLKELKNHEERYDNAELVSMIRFQGDKEIQWQPADVHFSRGTDILREGNWADESLALSGRIKYEESEIVERKHELEFTPKQYYELSAAEFTFVRKQGEMSTVKLEALMDYEKGGSGQLIHHEAVIFIPGQLTKLQDPSVSRYMKEGKVLKFKSQFKDIESGRKFDSEIKLELVDGEIYEPLSVINDYSASKGSKKTSLIWSRDLSIVAGEVKVFKIKTDESRNYESISLDLNANPDLGLLTGTLKLRNLYFRPEVNEVSFILESNSSSFILNGTVDREKSVLENVQVVTIMSPGRNVNSGNLVHYINGKIIKSDNIDVRYETIDYVTREKLIKDRDNFRKKFNKQIKQLREADTLLLGN